MNNLPHNDEPFVIYSLLSRKHQKVIQEWYPHIYRELMSPKEIIYKDELQILKDLRKEEAEESISQKIEKKVVKEDLSQEIDKKMVAEKKVAKESISQEIDRKIVTKTISQRRKKIFSLTKRNRCLINLVEKPKKKLQYKKRDN